MASNLALEGLSSEAVTSLDTILAKIRQAAVEGGRFVYSARRDVVPDTPVTDENGVTWDQWKLGDTVRHTFETRRPLSVGCEVECEVRRPG